MTCTATNGEDRLTYESAMYLFFPPGYEQSRRQTFYLFLIIDAHAPGARADLTPIVPVIRSFTLK